VRSAVAASGLAASGLAMVHEIATQLRGEAEERQVEGARVGLVHNAGGLIGFDEALAGVAVIEAPTRLGAGA
jgi:acetyl-CoA acetyltransferase